MLLSMLGAHPRIAAIPIETDLFARKRYAGIEAVTFHWRAAQAQLILAREPIKPDAHRWCEKTPRNVVCIEHIFRRFGDRVRFIHIIRDGRDVVTSSHPTHEGPYIPPARWVADVTAGLRYEGHPLVYTVRYEALVLDYEPTMRALLDWLGEPFTEEMRAYHEHTTVRVNSAWKGPVRPVSASSVGRWRDPRHAEQVRSLVDHPEAQALLVRLGYVDAPVASPSG